jgi:hypothetical protein
MSNQRGKSVSGWTHGRAASAGRPRTHARTCSNRSLTSTVWKAWTLPGCCVKASPTSVATPISAASMPPPLNLGLVPEPSIRSPPAPAPAPVPPCLSRPRLLLLPEVLPPLTVTPSFLGTSASARFFPRPLSPRDAMTSTGPRCHATGCSGITLRSTAHRPQGPRKIEQSPSCCGRVALPECGRRSGSKRPAPAPWNHESEVRQVIPPAS